jgi:nicotinate-nucleotide pyrophosphorylase (carboxylating)
MVARQNAILAGLDCALKALQIIDNTLEIKVHKHDGDTLNKGDIILEIKGAARSILMAERVALNFAGHLSGVATKTANMVSAVKGTNAKIVCTRKTIPNLRVLQKQAVRLGGGYNHRFGLDDAVLIKDNHIAIMGSVENAVKAARQHLGHMVKIEVECDTLEQVKQVLELNVDVIMLDNMNIDTLKQAIKIINSQAKTEASGGVDLHTVRSIAETGVDMISSGALTHSVMNVDLAFDFVN